MWLHLRDEIEELFAPLALCLDARDWSGLHAGAPKDVGIRVRRIGRDPAKLEARRAYQRERMRRIRLTNPSYGHAPRRTDLS